MNIKLITMVAIFFIISSILISDNYQDDFDLTLIDLGTSELSSAIQLFTQDVWSVRINLKHEIIPLYQSSLFDLYRNWQKRLDRINYDSLSLDGRIDYLLFKNYLQEMEEEVNLENRELEKIFKTFPTLSDLVDLEARRIKMIWYNAQVIASILNKAIKSLNIWNQKDFLIQKVFQNEKINPLKLKDFLNKLLELLKDWHQFYSGYDPDFNWWCEKDYETVIKEVEKFIERLEMDNNDNDKGFNLSGIPIGRDALLNELKREFIPYQPEELVEIGEQELNACKAEMLKASQQLGYGNNWKQALEFVKQQFVPPGKFPEKIVELNQEAISFIDKHNLLTIPQIVREVWQIKMHTPRQQLLNPFFTGGRVVSLSYPVNSMDYERKMMTMRGNNIFFSRATIFHELIPGHHLQLFMADRYRAYRKIFSSPFFVEGWALYWEMLFWDLNFNDTPEKKIGALFWRMHRCARIIFSIKFHLGKMSAEECINFLVENIGLEIENARAEVRRSISGLYDPLYQCAYLIGGLQLRELCSEILSKNGSINKKNFHDFLLKENEIPISLIRAKLLKDLNHETIRNWRFYKKVSFKK